MTRPKHFDNANAIRLEIVITRPFSQEIERKLLRVEGYAECKRTSA